MLSIRARMIKFLMQNRHILSGHLRKETIDWSTYEAVLAFRRQVEDGAGKFGKLPDGMEVKPVDIGGMYAEWLIPRGADQEKVIFYCHGGGYVSGTCHAHRAIVAKFVQKSGMQALLFEYRLAPEHPYPAAVEDAVAAYRWLMDQDLIPSNIVFLGDSAGGGLCLAALLALKDRGIPLPAGAAVYSPVTDYTCSGESYRTKAKVCLAPPGIGPAFGRHYAGEHDLRDPYISPLFGDLHGLPDLLIFAGEDETLRDDAVRFADKAQKAGVNVTLHVGEGLFHCYPAMAPLFPEAVQAMDEICSFLRDRVS